MKHGPTNIVRSTIHCAEHDLLEKNECVKLRLTSVGPRFTWPNLRSIQAMLANFGLTALRWRHCVNGYLPKIKGKALFFV